MIGTIRWNLLVEDWKDRKGVEFMIAIINSTPFYDKRTE